MDVLRSIFLLIPGVIHLLPVTGVLGSPRLAALYGVGISEPNILIMMQHRAVLLGTLGVFMIVAAFRSELQISAIIAGLLSTLSFIVLAVLVGGYNESIQRVMVADVIAIVCLLIAAASLLFSKEQAKQSL